MAHKPSSFRVPPEILTAMDALGSKLVKHTTLDRTHVLIYLVREACEANGMQIDAPAAAAPKRKAKK